MLEKCIGISCLLLKTALMLGGYGFWVIEDIKVQPSSSLPFVCLFFFWLFHTVFGKNWRNGSGKGMWLLSESNIFIWKLTWLSVKNPYYYFLSDYSYVVKPGILCIPFIFILLKSVAFIVVFILPSTMLNTQVLNKCSDWKYTYSCVKQAISDF